jgi:hypothetical protein
MQGLKYGVQMPKAMQKVLAARHNNNEETNPQKPLKENKNMDSQTTTTTTNGVLPSSAPMPVNMGKEGIEFGAPQSSAQNVKVVSFAELMAHGIKIEGPAEKSWKGHGVDVAKTAAGTLIGIGASVALGAVISAIFGGSAPEVVEVVDTAV